VDNTFPAALRLRNERDIKAVLARRDIFRGRRLIFYRGPMPSPGEAGTGEEMNVEHRFCLAVSRKCGTAVRRNRIRRLLREIIRTNRGRIPTGYDYIIRIGEAALTDTKIKQDLFIADFNRYFGWD
jgi:ribonuclease P protein component